MPVRPHREFHSLDLEDGWEAIPGYPKGFQHRILVSNLDESSKRGRRSRLMRIDPGAFSTQPFIHDHWEEVLLLEGDLIVGNDETGKGGTQFHAPTYAIRPPAVRHGPFTTQKGCIMFELHYYDVIG
jgi:hypothetical protein